MNRIRTLTNAGAIVVLFLVVACTPDKSPTVPAAPAGPDSGQVGGWYGYSTTSTSPNNDSIRIAFDWNDGFVDTMSLDPSGTVFADSHAWIVAGHYNVKAVALDQEGRVSAWSAAHPMVINAANKMPPVTPAAPDGPSTGVRNIAVTFTAVTTDPDGESLSYRFDWDYRNEKSDWTGYVPSGQSASYSYSWNRVGTYDVRVQARDTDGHVSAWSPPHALNIP